MSTFLVLGVCVDRQAAETAAPGVAFCCLTVLHHPSTYAKHKYSLFTDGCILLHVLFVFIVSVSHDITPNLLFDGSSLLQKV